jgi:hypothetical protein
MKLLDAFADDSQLYQHSTLHHSSCQVATHSDTCHSSLATYQLVPPLSIYRSLRLLLQSSAVLTMRLLCLFCSYLRALQQV